MLGWKNFQPDDFKDKNSASLSMDGRKRKTPDSGTLHDTHKRIRLPDDNLVETLQQPEHANHSVSNTNKTVRLSEQGWRDENVHLQAEVNLLKELIELKDEKIQEWAVRSKADEVQWQEEGHALAEENSVLRHRLSTLKKDMLCLQRKADDLKRANEEHLNRIIANSRKCYASEGIQAVTSDESSNVLRLKEENRILHAENNDLRDELRLCLEGNHALSEEVTRLNTMATSKGEIIQAWEKRVEEWQLQKPSFGMDVDTLQRASKDNARQSMGENQRPHEIGATEASPTTNSATDNMVLRRSVLPTPQNSSAISNQILDDQPDRDETRGSNMASTSLEPLSSLPGISAEERSSPIIAAEGSSMTSSLIALNHEFDHSLVMTPDHNVDNTGGIPLKRKRGRPKGSKNKHPTLASIRAALNSGVDVPKRKRGRPPKEKKPPALGDDGEPLPKRKRGRPLKIRKPDDTHTTNKKQGSNSVQSNSTHLAEVRSSTAPYDLPSESLSPNGHSPPHDIADDQLLVPINETVLGAETDAGEIKSPQMDVESDNPDGAGKIKLEHNGLTEHHLELIYHTENGKLFCVLCERTRARGTPIVSFHTGTSHQKLLEHCHIHHPHECAKFVRMSPEKLADMRNRYVGSIAVNLQILEQN